MPALTAAVALVGTLVGAAPPSAGTPRVAQAPAPPSAPGAPPAPAPGPAALPGVAAPAAIVEELRVTLARAIQRFDARDVNGVLAYVSDQYWTGPLTKPTIRGQLFALFQVYEAFQAHIRIDDVRLVGEHAWVYSTGTISGRLPIVGQWMTLYWWERDLEVARREGGTWRLYGYQQ